VARTHSPTRLADITAAATRVFGRIGYRRTQMGAVASEAGVSQGSLYSYVESKDALFHLVFADGFGEFEASSARLPIPTPETGETIALVKRGLRRAAATPCLVTALEADPPDDVRAELAAIVTEQYEMISRVWPLLAVIERSAADLPEFEQFYFGRGRPVHLQRLARYIDARSASGHFRTTADSAVAARIVAEITTWFGGHRHDDRDARLYDEAGVLPTIVAFVCDALIEPSR
jgi:AcrR family transcriptional regulator